MNAAKQAFFLFATLVVLACSGWYFASSKPHFRLDAQTLLSTTDTVMTNVYLVQYSAAGALANSLKTPLMRHTPKNNTHWLKKPHIVITQENQSAWEIDAQQATALYGGQKITFKDQVHIHQHPGPHNEESTFTTEQITYYPKTKHAVTSKDVLFIQAGTQIQSKGMRADLEKKRVKLLSRARGVYAPKQG
jgi:lipopolysaccharide export system protein LptC